MTCEQAVQVAPLLKALADPTRLRLLSIVLSHEGGEACVCDLTPHFDLSQPTISHHLKVLYELRVAGPGEAGHLGLLQGPTRGDGRAAQPLHQRHGGRGRGMRVSDTVHDEPRAADTGAVVAKLSTLDRFLPVWIVAAMVVGLLLGRLVPGLDDALDRGEDRRRLAADRDRAAGDDVPGAGQGPLRPSSATSPATGGCWSSRWC